MDVVKPSVIVHVAEKYLQLAATNQHDGGSYNTYYTISKTWGLYWTLWRQNRNMVYARMKESAVGAPNWRNIHGERDEDIDAMGMDARVFDMLCGMDAFTFPVYHNALCGIEA